MTDRPVGDAVFDLTVTGDEPPPSSAPPPGPEQPASRRRGLLIVVAAAVAFVLGVGVGYVARGRVTPTAAPTAAPTTRPVNVIVRSTSERCSVVNGDYLVLGVQLHNEGPGTINIREILIRLPLGGFLTVGVSFGRCGLDTPPISDQTIDEGAAGWVAVLLQLPPSERCPQPLPVLFAVVYEDSAGVLRESEVGGFPDLGSIGLPSCSYAG